MRTQPRQASASTLRRVVIAAMLPVATVLTTITAGSSAAGGGSATTESSVPPGETVLRDSLGRITVTVPAEWTDTTLSWTIGDDGRPRPRIQASPDYSAALDGWVIPRVSFVVRPPSFEPATVLDIWASSRSCVDGGIEPFDNGAFNGLRQTWTECGGGTYQLVHVAARPTDGSYTALVRIGVPTPDDPAVELILGSFGTVPGAVALPPSAPPGSLEVTGAVDESIVEASVPAGAVEHSDDTGRLTIAVPSEWTDVATNPGTNDDWSPRPLIRASTDIDAYAVWDAPGTRARIIPAIDPSVLLANFDWPTQRCTDGGVRSYERGDGFAGLVQTWVDCNDSDARLVVAALATPDESATVVVEVKQLDPDDAELAEVLASVRVDATSPESPVGTDADSATNDFCTSFAPLNEQADEIFAGDAPDASALRQLLGSLAELDPPEQIADDYALLLEAFTLYADALDGDTAAQTELNERFDEFDAANERLEPYLRDVCGVEFGD